MGFVGVEDVGVEVLVCVGWIVVSLLAHSYYKTLTRPKVVNHYIYIFWCLKFKSLNFSGLAEWMSSLYI